MEGPKILNDVAWQLQLQLAQDNATKLTTPVTVFEFKTSNPKSYRKGLLVRYKLKKFSFTETYFSIFKNLLLSFVNRSFVYIKKIYVITNNIANYFFKKD